MIQRDITNHHAGLRHLCGQPARLIQSSGHATFDPRLYGQPAEQFHVECCCCGVTTAPHTTVGMVLGDWRKGRTIPVTRLPALRIALDLARLAVPA